MDLSVFENMNSSELKSYLEFLLWHYRVMDGFWFLYVSDEFDQQAAERINKRVWGKIPAMAARNLLKRFQINEKGLDGFAEALRYFPWHILMEYKLDKTEDKIVLTVPNCPPQVARLRKGLPEFDCKEMHRGEFESFAHVIDDRIQVECIFAPPDSHPDDCFCKWQFTLKE